MRSDEYGGDRNRRNKFILDVVKVAVEKVGSDRIGVRISPYGVFNDMSGNYKEIAEQYTDLATELGKFHLAYIHLVDHSAIGAPKPDAETVKAICNCFRKAGGGAVILSGGYDMERAENDLASGEADLIAFGRPFISNPDLVERLKKGLELNDADQTTFYAPGSAGYTDYPLYQPIV